MDDAEVYLLATKLSPPPLRSHLIARSRLIERLNRINTYAFTLISAPAGFGKTTLLAQWAAQYQYPIAWISLDADDNDPVRFWSSIIVTLEQVCPGVREYVLPLLRFPQAPPLQSLLVLLINKLSTISAHIVLCLDDYHVINEPRIHESIIFLLEHLPNQTHIVIGSRVDPPLPIARLRGLDQINELHAVDLRFTHEEAKDFFASVMQLSLSQIDLATLEERTEGWIVGLQLVALSLQGREDISGFLSTFSGKHRFILDYFVEEVLARQPKEVQTFLYVTSILDRLTASLCDAVTERDDGQQMLRRLEQANLFLVPLDDEGKWYRYHHLFSDVLRTHLQEVEPELYRLASVWYEQHGNFEEAIHHALAALDFTRAVYLIEQVIEVTMFEHAERTKSKKWLDALPYEVLSTSPRLKLLYALLFNAGSDNSRVVQVVKEVEDYLGTDEEQSQALRGELKLMHAALSMQGDIGRAIQYGEEALADLPPERIHWRGLAIQLLGIAYQISGETEKASRLITETLHSNRARGQLHVNIAGFCNLGMILQNQGLLHRAANAYQQAISLAAHLKEHLAFSPGNAYVSMGALYYEWNELEQAYEHLMHGIRICRKQEGAELFLLTGYLYLMYLRLLEHNREEAEDLHEQIKHLLLSMPANSFSNAANVEALSIKMRLAQGDIEPAVRWAKQFKGRAYVGDTGSNPSFPSHVTIFERQVLAYILILQGQASKALQILNHLVQEPAPSEQWTIELFAIQALAYFREGNRQKAMHNLEQALAKAEPEGYIRTFVNLGTPMRALLAEASTTQLSGELSSVSSRYLQTLLPTFGIISAPEVASPLLEKRGVVLSQREIEVLRLLEVGSSNQDIAELLVLSLSTIKTHLQRIYTKLDVTNRTQALKRAREIHILP